MPLCRECGGQFRSEARYCPHCGVAVVEDAPTPSDAPSSSSQQETPQQYQQPSTPPTDARTIAMFCHLASFAGFFIPLGNTLGPLVVWLFKRYDSPYIDHHGKEALNFQISLTVYLIISAVLIIVFIGLLLIVVVGLAGIVFTIIAAVRASEGAEYRYPLTVRLIK